MTNEDIEKLIEDMSETYAEENQDFYLCYDIHGDTTDYYSLKHAFIAGFRACMEYKEEENKIRGVNKCTKI